MILELLMLISLTNIAQLIFVLLAGFILVITGLIFLKYFKFIFGYLMLFAFLGFVFYAGWQYWPIP